MPKYTTASTGFERAVVADNAWEDLGLQISFYKTYICFSIYQHKGSADHCNPDQERWRSGCSGDNRQIHWLHVSWGSSKALVQRWQEGRQMIHFLRAVVEHPRAEMFEFLAGHMGQYFVRHGPDNWMRQYLCFAWRH